LNNAIPRPLEAESVNAEVQEEEEELFRSIKASFKLISWGSTSCSNFA